jgi:hypothetical protein
MNFTSFWGKTLDQKIGKKNHVFAYCEKVLHQGTNFAIQMMKLKLLVYWWLHVIFHKEKTLTFFHISTIELVNMLSSK